MDWTIYYKATGEPIYVTSGDVDYDDLPLDEETDAVEGVHALDGSVKVLDGVVSNDKAAIAALKVEAIRSERNALLLASDWTQLNDAPLTIEQVRQWAVYRQSLRDLPEQADPVWPNAPGE